MWKIIQDIPLPFVVHFRISTIGGVTKQLCHPFPVTKDCSTDLTGTASMVLFHNGIWNRWEEACMNMVLLKNAYFPNGQWSDSRALAWLTHQSNTSFLRFTNQKIAIHSPKRIHLAGDFQEDEGVLYSNLSWKNDYKTQYITHDDQYYQEWWSDKYGIYQNRSRCGKKAELKSDTKPVTDEALGLDLDTPIGFGY
jgi:hypothetical protein